MAQAQQLLPLGLSDVSAMADDIGRPRVTDHGHGVAIRFLRAFCRI